jgi:hypothetical protein
MHIGRLSLLPAALAGVVAVGAGPANPRGGEWVINGYAAGPSVPAGAATHSVARLWMEEMLAAIRGDFARPPIHARNLFHLSVAMWDAWAVYSVNASPFLSTEHLFAADKEAAREEAISFAAYNLIKARFAKSPGYAATSASIDALMDDLGYDKNFQGTVGNSPRALGNRIAIAVLAYGLADGANEQGNYANQHYEPINDPLAPELPGDPQDVICTTFPDCPDGIPDYVLDPNRWQPLVLDFFTDQSGNVIIGGYPDAIGPEWGQVTPFSLTAEDLTVYVRPPPAPDAGFEYLVYHDPGPPPLHGGKGDLAYKSGHEMVSVWQSHLDPTDGIVWDISPASLGDAGLPDPGNPQAYYDYYGGGDLVGNGYPVNPVTGQPYAPEFVPRGDFARVLAEFWADGPTSETPPGHWITILNYVSDHPLTVKRLAGQGPILPALEWDVKTYLALAGGLHDTAIAVWGNKGWYDTSRPISAIRYMAGRGQCSDPQAVSFDPGGIELHPGFIELITPETIVPGARHEHLAGKSNENLGKVAVYTWLGHDFFFSDPPGDPQTEDAGVGWMLAELFMPYQRPSFVTPPFPGYTSGHSAYSRTGADVIHLLTGSPYFPGGLGEFFCPQNQFLVFEEGPSIDVTLQWAKYTDGATQSALSRIWGGIHPPFDDLPSRVIGSLIAPEAYGHALTYFEGSGYVPCPADLSNPPDADVDTADFLDLLQAWGTNPGGPPDLDDNGNVGTEDLLGLLQAWGPCPS